jgi:hypothetical protein
MKAQGFGPELLSARACGVSSIERSSRRQPNGIPDFFIRRSLGVVGQAPPIPKSIDAAEAIDELTSYDSFEPLVVSYVEPPVVSNVEPPVVSNVEPAPDDF